MNISEILDEMTNEEKVAFVSGTEFMLTNPIPRLNIPSLRMSDGPHGLRMQKEEGDNGVSGSEPATTFPAAATTASSWNPDNLLKMGEAIGRECRYYGVHTLLGPGVNIKRNPLCGRSFEYFSEDPYLAGVMGVAEVNGLKNVGVGASLKHFALNNSENYRFMGNSVASENTIRNLYLKPFEYVIKHAKPATVMCAYNKINGTYCSENKWLLTDVLRDEWGFEGVVMTDWGAVNDRVLGVKAGLDLEMPGDTLICRRWLLDAISDGSLPIEDLDKACENILRWVDEYVTDKDDNEPDWELHNKLCCDIATDSAVLMKNDGVLPLNIDGKYHITGELFENMRYQGAGSSMIMPTFLTTPADAFKTHGIRSVPVEEADSILVFAGLTDEYETEGCDREHMRLPDNQLELIDKMCQTGKKVVVVLYGGSPVELPFNNDVSAILNMYLPGQNGGEATYQLLFGEKNPSGKLAETWPMCYEDVPSHDIFSKRRVEVYEEGLEVGYRYYNRHNIEVRYPFGHGLSYTTFSQTDWVQNGNEYTKEVTNTGDVEGAEVCMLFLDGELAGFEKVYLKPNETKKVTVVIEENEKKIYSDEYVVPKEKPLKPVTLESRLSDLNYSFMGRILFNAVVSVADKAEKEAKKLPDGMEKENKIKGARFLRNIIVSNSLRSMSMTAGENMPYNFAQGFVELTNGHIIKGIKKFMTKIKVPALPKEEKYVSRN